MKVFGLRQVLTMSVLAASLALPSAAETVTNGQNEVLGFIGAVSDHGGVTLGGGIQHGVASRVLVTGELGYLTGNNSPFGNHGVTFDANLHYLFPLRGHPSITPYALGGFGLFHMSGDNHGHTSAGLNLGGGARWAIGKDWGLRPELKFLLGDGVATRFTVGIYKQF